jgi:hypothetical protein
MKISNIATAVVVSLALGVTAYPAFAKQDAKGKSTEKKATKDNSGRQAGELPSGLQKYSEKKGQLPSGLQKKKDEGQLTKGLEKGGKKLKTTTTN